MSSEHVIGTSRRLRAALGAMLVVVTAACGQGGAAGGRAGAATLRLGVRGTTGSLNLFAGPNADYDTLANLYPILVDYDLRTVEPSPGSATSWERSTDGLTWTFHTRPGVKWSDGEPLTARDAKFAFDTLISYQNGPTANYADYVKEIQSVETPDDNTLAMTLKTPVSTLISNTATVVYILPEHVWGHFATGDGAGLKNFTNEPAQDHPVVSGGPFMLTESIRTASGASPATRTTSGPRSPSRALGCATSPARTRWSARCASSRSTPPTPSPRPRWRPCARLASPSRRDQASAVTGWRSTPRPPRRPTASWETPGAGGLRVRHAALPDRPGPRPRLRRQWYDDRDARAGPLARIGAHRGALRPATRRRVARWRGLPPRRSGSAHGAGPPDVLPGLDHA